MGEMEMKQLGERVGRIKTAIAMGQPDRVPVCPFFSGIVTRFTGSSYRDAFYNHDRAGQAAIDFIKMYPNVDSSSVPLFYSGVANELAGTKMIDWPGRPGTIVPDFSSQQIIEYEFMEPEEYPELLTDYTGFMLRKFIPRSFTNLQGTKDLTIQAATMMDASMFGGLTSPGVIETFKTLEKIGEENAKATAATFKYAGIMAELGYPGMIQGMAEAPYDIIGDYFRGTMGIFEDITDEDTLPYVEQACWMFADKMIQNLQYLKYVDMPIKNVFFPLHKGMDGFLSDELYGKIYWEPLKKIIMALIDMGVTPYIYTEGPYNTRLDYLSDLPKGKCLVHFEKVDMKKAKEIVGKNSCISGNLSISQMEFGTPEKIINDTRYLLETCMPGGGYIFDFDGSLDNAKPENVDAMFETLAKYGSY